MSPTTPSENLPDGGFLYAEQCGECLLRNSLGVECANLDYLSFREYGFGIFASLWYSFFVHRILHVVILSTNKKMNRSEARRIVARVESAMPLRDRATSHLQRKPRYSNFLPTSGDVNGGGLPVVQVPIPFQARVCVPWQRRVVRFDLFNLCQKVMVVANLVSDSHSRALHWHRMLRPMLHQQRGLFQFTPGVRLCESY